MVGIRVGVVAPPSSNNMITIHQSPYHTQLGPAKTPQGNARKQHTPDWKQGTLLNVEIHYVTTTAAPPHPILNQVAPPRGGKRRNGNPTPDNSVLGGTFTGGKPLMVDTGLQDSSGPLWLQSDYRPGLLCSPPAVHRTVCTRHFPHKVGHHMLFGTHKWSIARSVTATIVPDKGWNTAQHTGISSDLVCRRASILLHKHPTKVHCSDRVVLGRPMGSRPFKLKGFCFGIPE